MCPFSWHSQTIALHAQGRTGISRQQGVLSVLLRSPARSGVCGTSAVMHVSLLQCATTTSPGKLGSPGEARCFCTCGTHTVGAVPLSQTPFEEAKITLFVFGENLQLVTGSLRVSVSQGCLCGAHGWPRVSVSDNYCHLVPLHRL